MYEELDDQKFVSRIFTSEDRLDLNYVKEAQRRAETVVPLLCEVLLQEKNYKRRGKDFWGVVHATYLLGILGEKSAFEALFAAGRFADEHDIDWIWEALPECYVRLGPSVIPRLKEHIEQHRSQKWELIANEAYGLWNLWQGYPDEKRGIEDFFLTLLKAGENHPEFNANVIADFTQIGRRDLRPLFVELFGKGEVDLDTLTPEDMDHFIGKTTTPPDYRKELEKFYSPEEIEKRQERWKEEDEREERRSFEEGLLANYKRIGRNEHCPCGSGKKFKKCHLPWVEGELMRRKDEAASEEILLENIGAVGAERRAETELRKFLASRGRTDLFPRIKEKVLEFLKAPNGEVQAKGFSGYFQELLSSIEFEGQGEAEQFMKSFQEYLNALAHQYRGHPRGGGLTH